MKRTIGLILVVTVVLCIAAAGVAKTAPQGSEAKKPTMRVGIVNVLRILTEMPEYRKYSEEYLNERKKLFNPGAERDPAKIRKLLKEREAKIKAAEEKWAKIKDQFLTDTMEKIKKASESVMKDKKLDFVLVDAPWHPDSPIRQIGAVDITTDVLLIVQGK